MTDQENAELAAKEAADKAKADEAADAGAQDENHEDDGGANEGAEADDEDSEQLKAELEREKKAREAAEQAVADKAYKLREANRQRNKNHGDDADEDQSDDAEDSDDKPMTRKEFEAERLKDREQVRKEVLNQEALRIAESMSTNETMRELIIEKWKNRVFPGNLSLQDQIEECYLAANKKRILGENSELKRALLGKKNVNKDGSGSHQDSVSDAHAPNMSAVDKAEFAKLGFKWNGNARRYEKKLPNGKMIVRDVKTKKTSLIKA